MELNYRNLDIKIYIKKVKNISIKIEFGKIYINIPKKKEKYAVKEAKKIIDEKYNWVIKNINKTKDLKEEYKLEYINNTSKLKIIGNIYDVYHLNNTSYKKVKEEINNKSENLNKIINEKGFLNILIYEKERKIYINNENLKNKYEYLDKVLKEILRETSRKLINKWKIILKIDIEKLKITSGKGNWGSCNTKKGYINLNKNLVYKNINEIEYVVLHELSHLFYPNHGNDFKNMLFKYMPDWKERKKNLNKKI